MEQSHRFDNATIAFLYSYFIDLDYMVRLINLIHVVGINLS
jgi:hypothetical protein